MYVSLRALCACMCVYMWAVCTYYFVWMFVNLCRSCVGLYEYINQYVGLYNLKYICVLCLFICVWVRSRLTGVFSYVRRFNHSQAANINKFIYNTGKTFGLPLSMPPKSDLNLRRFALELGVPVVKYTLRMSHLEEQTRIRMLRLKNSPSQRELPACFGWVMGRWTGVPRAADRSDSSINIFQQPNKPWRHVTNSLLVTKGCT
jgi:hypothetical protein